MKNTEDFNLDNPIFTESIFNTPLSIQAKKPLFYTLLTVTEILKHLTVCDFLIEINGIWFVLFWCFYLFFFLRYINIQGLN